MMLLLLALVLTYCSPVSGLLCYNPSPPTDLDNGRPSVILVDSANITPHNAVCIRYAYLCTQLDKACKPEQWGKLQWSYVTSSKETCVKLKEAAAVYKNVTCCTKDRCNAPDPKQDPVTKVLLGEMKVAKAPGAGKP
jgi:hypothetical protein